MRKKKEQAYIGKCPGCEKKIVSTEKYEDIYYDTPSQWNNYYLKGPVHNKCLVKVYKDFTNQLMRDNYALSDFLTALIRVKSKRVVKSGRSRSNTSKRRNK